MTAQGKGASLCPPPTDSPPNSELGRGSQHPLVEEVASQRSCTSFRAKEQEGRPAIEVEAALSPHTGILAAQKGSAPVVQPRENKARAVLGWGLSSERQDSHEAQGPGKEPRSYSV